MTHKDSIRVLSWNVNGLRACAKKGFLSWLDRCGAQIVGVQEVRARWEQLPPELISPTGWYTNIISAERAGYSGVGIYSRDKPDSIESTIGESRFDKEGRIQLARFGRLVVANIYFPNGSGKGRDNSRVPFKLSFYRKLFSRLQRLRRSGLRVIVIGDFNTAREEIDLARPQNNRNTSGFLIEERQVLNSWITAGWTDTFRNFETRPGYYTWWSQRARVREKNIGWRIDYILASPSSMKFVRRAFIETNTKGSDHCPIGIELDPAILRR